MSVPAFTASNRQRVMASNIARYSDAKLVKELTFAAGTAFDDLYAREWYAAVQAEAQERKLA